MKPLPKKYNNTNILVVENDYASYILIKEILTPYNFNLFHALNEKETWRILNSKNRCDLILMDVKLSSKIDGYSLSRDIKLQYSNITIIIQTACFNKFEKEEFRYNIYDDFIRKSYQICN